MLHKQLAKSIWLLLCLCFLRTACAIAQRPILIPAADTLRLEIKQAEKIFLDNNLQLLAAHYHVLGAEALAEQARKWDNPVLVTDQNVYSNKHFFQHGTDVNGNEQGQVFVQVQQLIKTAGKRGRQMDLANTNTSMAALQFKEVMRNLRFTLIKDYYTIAQLQGNATLYTENMQQLQKLLTAQEANLKAGNIARKEYLRVQALIMSLQQDMTDNANAMNDLQTEMRTMLQLPGNQYILPIAADTETAEMPDINIGQLIDSARQYNTDYKQAAMQLQYSTQNVRLQRAMAIPDLTVGPEYDRNSNYTPNYYGLSLSLPIPLWDRNKGNIKAAKWQVKESEAIQSTADQKLQQDVLNMYQKLLLAVRLSSGSNNQFYNEYYQLQQNIAESYAKRQISMTEFLEYYKDYQDVRQQQLQQTLNLQMAKAALNDITGTNVIK